MMQISGSPPYLDVSHLRQPSIGFVKKRNVFNDINGIKFRLLEGNHGGRGLASTGARVEMFSAAIRCDSVSHDSEC